MLQFHLHPSTLCILFIALFTPATGYAQNIEYTATINRFFASNCGTDGVFSPGEEHTWLGFLSDDTSPSETSTGCRQLNANGAAVFAGSFATRAASNSTATLLQTRIDAWENDAGDRCTFDTGTGFGGAEDDCRTQRTCTYRFTNPNEFSFTSRTETCGDADHTMRTLLQYKYATTDLSNATEYRGSSLLTTGSRPFWGARGNWAADGIDCAASGTIGNNQSSSFQTTVTCKRRVEFRWRVSSQAQSDYLEVYVNGVRKNRISGATSWAVVTLGLDFGSNIVEWRYVKDGAGSGGLDRGFVDGIDFIDATVVEAGSVSGDQTICSGGNPGILTNVVAGQSYSSSLNYQWQFSNNNISWANIGGATSLSYNPPAGLTQTRYYRRRAQDGCGSLAYSNTVTATVNPLPNGNLSGGSDICPGGSTNITFTGTAGTGPWDVTYNNTTVNNAGSGAQFNVSPLSSTTYTLTTIVDNNGCVRTTGLGTTATVTVNTRSTAPSIAPINDPVEPNATVILTASGGVSGTDAVINWYTGPNGTGLNAGSGNSISVMPAVTTTYYARREGTCNTTVDDNETVVVDPNLSNRVFLDNDANGYPTVTEAVAAAVDGQTIYISADAYNEAVDFGGKRLLIRIGPPPAN